MLRSTEEFRLYRYTKKDGKQRHQNVCKKCEAVNGKFKRLVNKEQRSSDDEQLLEEMIAWYKQLASNAGGHKNINMPSLARQVCGFEAAEQADTADNLRSIMQEVKVRAATLEEMIDSVLDHSVDLRQAIAYFENIDPDNLPVIPLEALDHLDDELSKWINSTDDDEKKSLYSELQAVIFDLM